MKYSINNKILYQDESYHRSWFFYIGFKASNMNDYTRSSIRFYVQSVFITALSQDIFIMEPAHTVCDVPTNASGLKYLFQKTFVP